eukprot:scaffold1344_cov102-Cylindrotheca_fusiformis.AAC.1
MTEPLCQPESLRQRIEDGGAIRDGFVLFGDNAYINTPYLVAPFKNVKSGSKDDFNYYHSSLRINIECAFGMLVHRWSCLQKPMPINFSTKKISSLTVALCKLHNFCIDSQDARPLPMTDLDRSSIRLDGGLIMP